MRVAALVLGVLGGLFGIGGAMFAAAIGGMGAAFGAEGAGQIVGLSGGALAFSLLGLVAGALAMTFPKVTGWLMIIAAVGGTISVSVGYVIAGPLLLVAGILALVGARRNKTAGSQAA